MYERNKSFMYNASGCYDPTAGAALKSVAKKMHNSSFYGKNQPVYICVSRQIKTEADIQYLKRCCIFAANQDAQPIVPALFYEGILDLSDQHDRSKLIVWTRNCLRGASEIWVFDGEPPESIKEEARHFVQNGRPIRYFESRESGEFCQTRLVRRQRYVKAGENAKG